MAATDDLSMLLVAVERDVDEVNRQGLSHSG